MSRTTHTMRPGGAARSGFTLVEVMIALLVSGLVLLGARLLLEGMADESERSVAAATRATAEANADRVLRDLVGQLEVGTDSATEFGGDERVVRFASWCAVPSGWEERCRVTLAVDSLDGRPVLAALLSTGEVLVLRSGFRDGQLCYLTSAAEGGHWLRGWGMGITAPLAIGVVLDGDTTILRIGERG